MSAADGSRLRQLFLGAKGLSAAARSEFLDRECSHDAELRTEVEALLEAAPLPDRHIDFRALIDGDGNTPRETEQTFGRFQLVRRLGSGGMGRVDLAFDPRNQREVAIKRLQPEWIQTAEMVQRFQREALAASQLEHPGLCPIYEVGHVDGVPYFVMPVLHGETLGVHLEGDAVPDRDRIAWILRIFERVALALHQAHEAGLVHRDIKPGNIMVSPDDMPVLMDFGLVQDDSLTIEQRLTRTGQFPGTPAYMAPEQVFGEGADRRTDVYALGVAMYESVCGRRPFDGSSHVDLFEQIRHTPLPSPRRQNPAISRELAAILEVATDKDPTRRYHSAVALAADLERLRRHLPVQARRMPLWLRTARWCRRNPAATATAAGLAVGFAVTLGLVQQRTSLNESLRTTIRDEQTNERAADAMRAVAQDRLDEFDSIAVLRRIEDARGSARLLFPAWPSEVGRLQDWLDTHGVALKRDARMVKETLARLEARATPRAEHLGLTDRVATIRGQIADLTTKIDALAATLARRTGPRSEDLPALPNDAPTDTQELLDAAWQRIAPDRTPAQYGEEAMGVTYAFAAGKREGTGPLMHEAMRVAVHAVIAAGLDGGNPMAAGWVESLANAPGPEDQPHRYATTIQHAEQVRLTQMDALLDARLERARLRADLHNHWRIGLDSDGSQALERYLHLAEKRLEVALGKGGVLERVENQARWSRSVRALTLDHPSAGVTWPEIAAELAAPDTCAPYSPMKLEPQMGLVPLGRNPATRLFEFYHLRSAIPGAAADASALAIPKFDAQGRLDPADSPGIVFVLLPGGEDLRLGAQKTDPSAPHYDPMANRNESVRQVNLAPFFLARHELTQGQWMRLTGETNPSGRQAATTPRGLPPITDRHPVERVTWTATRQKLQRFSLRLPTEWEWEYGARANTATTWSFGDNSADLVRYGNVADMTLRRAAGASSYAKFDDGHALHAPVGSYLPNSFGLYDMYGNVAEMCEERLDGQITDCTIRGGQWARVELHTRSSARSSQHIGSPFDTTGFRPARSIQPEGDQ